MGIDSNGARFLLYAYGLGASFKQTAMIGRQSLNLTKYELYNIFRAFGNFINDEDLNRIYSNNSYAEPLFIQLGAEEVHSFDFSTYEGATHIHDMNLYILEEVKEHYSVVIDGGSLEHIFNFPQAVKNCMEMLKINGCYLGITPGNNFMGHGFYQFSPELFFRIFTEQNGFKLIDLIVFEDRPNAQWYRVKDPKDIKARILLTNDRPVYLLIIAKKIANTSIFKDPPQQSDYETTWGENDKDLSRDAKSSSNRSIYSFRNWVKMVLPSNITHLIQSAIYGYGFNPRYFSPIIPEKLSRITPKAD